MVDSITRQDGTVLTANEAITCAGTDFFHDFIYLGKISGQYRCRRCRRLFTKAELKALTDEGV